MSDAEHVWRPSPTPQESWSDAEGANELGEWPVKAVVGEELRLDGTSRYEVRWGNWHRPDGSNTTWETDKSFDRVDLIRKWQKKQQRLRASLAEQSVDMEVPWQDDAVHKRLTDQRRQAYDEKKEKRRRAGQVSTADWDEEIEKAYGRLQEPERGEANSKLRLRRGNPPSAAGSSASVSAQSTSSQWSKRPSPVLTISSRDQPISSGPPPSKRGRGRPRTNTPTSSPRSAVTPFSHKGKLSALAALTPSSAGSSSMEIDVPPSKHPSVIISQPTLRGRVSSTWHKTAKEAKAATVRISRDISDDDFPRNLRKFKYMERGYIFYNDALKDTFNVSRGAFTTCECMTCSPSCPCRDLSKVYDLGSAMKISTYSEGLFTFEIPRGVDVIECNKYCGCDNDCGNRVAQRPRDIGIEIFDTNRCGWGARTLEDVPRGKVLGTYTGMLVRRDEIDNLPEEHHGYMFDLDSTEVRNSTNFGEKYTVDCYECGNWTRFVNHSCSPNMAVYCVVYDTIPYMNMPYVAFAASTNIPAGTELTIDYYPHAETDKKGKRPADGGDCRCGSEVCRGWFKM